MYYRHTKPITERFPARVLWYASGGDKFYSHAKSIVASSYLTDVMTGNPKTLFRVNNVLEFMSGEIFQNYVMEI